jgi:hypothetical protein
MVSSASFAAAAASISPTFTSTGPPTRGELAPAGMGVSVLCPGPVASGLATNSGASRPARFGGPVDVKVGEIDAAAAAKLAELTMPASRAAEIALRGLRAGAFVIPTHRYEKDDVDARYREIARGFDLLD